MVAYVVYSTYRRLQYGSPPGDGATPVFLVAALLPDLVDKLLASQLSVLRIRRSLAHSLLLVLVVLAVARACGIPEFGMALGVGYLSHLPADAIYPAIIPGVKVDKGYPVWPFAFAEPSEMVDLLARTLELDGYLSAFVSGSTGWRFSLLEGALTTVSRRLWLVDCRPDVGLFRESTAAGPGV